MTQLHIINLVKTWCDGSDNVHTENFAGLTIEDAYKGACEYLFDEESELFEELGIEFPTQSIDFIKDGDGYIYQQFLDKMMVEIMEIGSCHLDVDRVKVQLVIEDNKIKDIKTGDFMNKRTDREYIATITKDVFTVSEGKMKTLTNPSWDGDWHRKVFPDKTEKNSVEAFSVDGEYCGIKFTEELLNSDGIEVMFFIPTGTKEETVKQAIAEIKFDRDVVRVIKFYEQEEL